MKQLILTLILVTLSAPVCFGEWLKVATSNDGDTFHIDYERIRERGEYVYFWQLADADSPKLDTGFEWMSAKSYKQGDCDQFRYKELNLSVYSQPMGEGTLLNTIDEPDENWTYPPPDSVGEGVLEKVCDYVKLSEKERQGFLRDIRPSRGFLDLVRKIEIREKNKE